MSDHEKQAIVDRLFQCHEVRVKVLEEIEKDMSSMRRTMNTIAGILPVSSSSWCL